MLSIAHLVGVDPGIVHTGVVSLAFRASQRTLVVRHTVISGLDAEAVADWVLNLGGAYPKVIVEQYRPRQNLNADTRMVQGEQDLRRALPQAQFLSNMGVYRVVTEPTMRALEVWSFPTSTHHGDLRSAARIALLGMVKNDLSNEILANMVQGYLDNDEWTVIHQ